MRVPFVSFEAMHNEIKQKLIDKSLEVIASNRFIGGNELSSFEEKFANYCKVK